MMELIVQFCIMCETKFGQRVVICGETSPLGSWTPAKGVRLVTSQKHYPYWGSAEVILMKRGVPFEFKLVVLDEWERVVRWESLPTNRVVQPWTDLCVEFVEADSHMRLTDRDCRNWRPSALSNTLLIVDGLESDSSSDKDIWEQYGNL